MAITELQAPQTRTPAFNDMLHVINSTNKNQTNFKYIFKVYVNGTYIGKSFKVAPDSVHGFGLFDAKRIIGTYVTYDLDLSVVGATRNSNNNDYYSIQYGEEYGDLSSGVTSYNNLAESSTIYAYAGSFRTLDFISYVDDTYIMDSSGSLFMTNQPRPFRIFEDQYAWLGAMDDTIQHMDEYRVLTYNISGTLLNTFRINNGFRNDFFIKIITGWNLNSIDSSEFNGGGSQPILTSSVYYYTVQMYDGNNPISELFRFNCDSSCEWDTGGSYDVYFLNALGWFDSIRFNRLNTKSHEINAKYYKQSTGSFGASSFDVAKTDRAKTQYYTSYTDKWKLRSAYLTEAESTWLLELVTSPQVFINVNSELIPCTITQSNYDERKRSEGQIFNLEIDVEFSVKNYRQRF